MAWGASSFEGGILFPKASFKIVPRRFETKRLPLVEPTSCITGRKSVERLPKKNRRNYGQRARLSVLAATILYSILGKMAPLLEEHIEDFLHLTM